MDSSMTSAPNTPGDGSACLSPDVSLDGNGAFPRIPSESALTKNNMELLKAKKPWERSQSALDLEPKNMGRCKSSSVDYGEVAIGGKVSEHSRVYWDLSKVEDDSISQQTASSNSTTTNTTTPSSSSSSSSSMGGKFKISLQTIHQKEEMKASSSPSVSIQTRMIRRMQSEASMHPQLMSPPSPTKAPHDSAQNTPSPGTTHSKFMFTMNQTSKPNLTMVLASAVPVMKESIQQLAAVSVKEQRRALDSMKAMIEQAWATPTIGRDLAYGLCDVIRSDGGLELLIKNCAESTHEIKLGSAQVLEQSMTVGNREYVAQCGLDVIVKMACKAKDDQEMTKATTGILESLFKHSEETCSKVIKFGGLDTILHSCRYYDNATLRHCAVALANLAIYGGEENQHKMIALKAPEWLFPLAFSTDDSTRYYAFLAISALSANKELEPAVAKSGTLDLVEPFIRTHDPEEFACSDSAHIHGQSKDWLLRLVPLLDSNRPEAQSLAAFHFAMEAGIKAQQGKQEIFAEIGAVDPLKRLASITNKLASTFARQALQTIGEEVPYKLTPQVPLWTRADVIHWLQQTGFSDYTTVFSESQVDGDILLSLTMENLKTDLDMTNGLTCIRFMRELCRLKCDTDYQSCDPSGLTDWLRELGSEFTTYSYQMLKSGADRRILRWLTEEHLLSDCGIHNGIHRMKIMEGAKRLSSSICSPLGRDYGDYPYDKSLDVFISYRRSTGSQLASLLKVHLQLRGLTVFLDIEKLRAGKFDDNLLNSVRNARNFILILTPNSLDRCLGDSDQKDWVHREVVAALEGGCNIIPVMDNYQWPPPETLPEDMRPICYFNGIRWIHDYQEACVDKLEKFISGELSTRQPCVIQRPSLSKGSSLSSMPDVHGSIYRMGSSMNGASPTTAPITAPEFSSVDKHSEGPSTHG